MEETTCTPVGDAERLASLCRLALSDEEKSRLSADLSEMIRFADALLGAETDGIFDGEKIARAVGVVRSDTAAPPFNREKLLAASPSASDGYVAVVRILGEEAAHD